jgi:hypothetical protein
LYEIWGGLDNMVENLIATTQGDSADQPSSFGSFSFGIPALAPGGIVFLLADGIVKLAYRNPGT